MSGHSKWAKIKRQKGANDVKKGAIFTKLGRNITLAAKEGGGDMDTNFALRIAVDKAKAVNMPSDNIDRSIKKGIGGDDKSVFQKISYEAIVAGVAVLIDCQTDNTNRTVSEVKKILEMSGAKLASPGSINWQFSEKGLIVIRPEKLKKSEKFGGKDTYTPLSKEDVEMALLDIEGIEDIEEDEYEDEEEGKFSVLLVTTSKNDFAKALKEIEKLEFRIVSFELIRKANDHISVDDSTSEKLEKLVTNLEDHDDVDAVWTNIKEK